MNPRLPRRAFLKSAAALALLGALDLRADRTKTLPMPSAAKLPRWRGFNLLEKFGSMIGNTAFREKDFEIIAGWGFDFVRLPMSYLCWSSHDDWRRMDEKVLAQIDEAVEFGRQYGIHVSINFHRAPGYSVDNSIKEPFNLWTDAEAQEAACYHWAHFARRYKDIPNDRLSFDLVNEPATLRTDPFTMLPDAAYIPVATKLVEAIRAESPGRLIISDGLQWGTVPVPGLAGLGIAQSTRGYNPSRVTHWKASWIKGSDTWPEPTWPLQMTETEIERDNGFVRRNLEVFKDNPIMQEALGNYEPITEWNRDILKRETIAPWKALEAMGVGVHVGEWGVFNQTPHKVALAFMRDATSLWKEAGWGWALWNLRGGFGVLDSDRPDATYEAFRGHKLDRAMLEVLLEG